MTVTAQFQDRCEAGQFLATKLTHHAGDPSLVVLALPRGGVPVAYEVAKVLKAPLDIFLIRKLGVPGYEELSMGAVASGGLKIFNHEVIQHLGISEKIVEAITREKQQELEHRELIYRGKREPVALEGRTVILVDDGLALGASMRAAVHALRIKQPKSIIAAVPIGSADTCNQIRSEADEVVCGMAPDPFYSVGAWYSDFIQITDEEINHLLNHAAHERRMQQVRQTHKDRHPGKENFVA